MSKPFVSRYRCASSFLKNVSVITLSFVSLLCAFDCFAQTDKVESLSSGEILYGYRCKGCHEPVTPGAPSRQRMGRMDIEEIIESLSRGDMKIMAPNLSSEEMLQIAKFLVESK